MAELAPLLRCDSGGYIQSDPIGLAGGVNTYGYVRNSPVSLIDSWGLVDLNWMHPTRDGYLYRQGQMYNNPAFFTVLAHSDGRNFQDDLGQIYTPYDLAREIRNNPKYKGQPVQLTSCNAGNNAHGHSETGAQALAALGLSVYAPTNYATMANGLPLVMNGGTWQWSLPASGPSRR